MNHSKSSVPKIPLWFSVSKNLEAPTIQLNFPMELGNKGFIPKELNNFFSTNQINNRKSLVTKIINLTQETILKKWNFRTRLIYHPELKLQIL